MEKLTLSDVIVKQLELSGVERIYGLIGDSLNPFGQAVKKSTLEWVTVRHEEIAAYAAAGEAELTNKLTVCAGTCGPGSVHLVNGLYEANRNQNPVLAIVSQIPSSEIGFDYFQETHPERVFTDCSIFCEMLINPEQMPRLLFTAIQNAISKKGVAVLIIPGDMMATPVPKMPELRAPIYSMPQMVPQQADIINLAKILNSHEKIAIYCGYGCKDCMDEVTSLAKTLQAPCMYTMRSRYFAVPDNPYAVGMNGYLADGSAKIAISDCDCLILLGTDYPFDALLPKTPTLVQIDNNGAHIGRRSRIDCGIIGDIKPTLQSLLPLLTIHNKSYFLKNALSFAQKTQAQAQEKIKTMANAGALAPEYLTQQISQIADDDALFVIDVGLNDKWAARILEPTKNRQIIGSFKHGTMAAAVGEAIGAAFANPKRQIIVLAGDGGLTMLLGDLLTIIEYNLPIHVIVYNNSELGYINFEATIEGYEPFATKMKNPDFEQLAKVMGFNAFTLKKPQDTGTVLTKAFALHAPVFINALTDPLALGI